MIEEAMKLTLNNDLKNKVSYRAGKIENEVRNFDSSKKKYDLVFSNAALHWCTDHVNLFPQIIKTLVNANGGVLAVQMPDTRAQQSHLLMETAALRSGLLNSIMDVRIPRVEYDPDWYYNLLFPLCKDIDLWSTEYTQQLPVTTVGYGLDLELEHPVLEWTKATGLKPILDALGGEESEKGQKYLFEYGRLLKEEYPIINMRNKFQSNGKLVTLLPYKRFFIICKL
jgi:trans-aconitate 2-methyltransferase